MPSKPIDSYWNENHELRNFSHPIPEEEMRCPTCGCETGFGCLFNPMDRNDTRRVWICGNGECASRMKAKEKEPEFLQRIVEWEDFCYVSDMPDGWLDCRFEKIEQSEGKIAYLRKFAECPRGEILMTGTNGTGKTYCATALCELYLRKRSSCRFCTFYKLMQMWEESQRGRDPTAAINWVRGLSEWELLVIDELGIADLSKGFTHFLFDVLNKRTNSNRCGTVFTSNLSPAEFDKIYGTAISDRLAKAILFVFQGKSRRKNLVL